MVRRQLRVSDHEEKRASGFHRSRSLKEMLFAASSDEHVSPDWTVSYDVQFVNEPAAKFEGASRVANRRGLATAPYATAARTMKDLTAMESK